MTAEQKFWKLCRRPIEFTVDIEEIDIACGREPGHEGRCTMDREDLITKLYFLVQNSTTRSRANG